MALKRTKKRRRASITSLIDVIFLLLLFFMLSSTFSRFSEVELVASGPSGGTAGPDQQFETLVIDAQGVTIAGTPRADDTIAGALMELQTGEPLVLAVTPAEGVTTQRLIDVLTILSATEGVDVRLVEPSS
ncbi:MAG: biopolymer transporter ExbD [Pseudomonadota bacterium]